MMKSVLFLCIGFGSKSGKHHVGVHLAGAVYCDYFHMFSLEMKCTEYWNRNLNRIHIQITALKTLALI